MFTSFNRHAALHWAITFGLLAVVAGGFAMSGTVSETLSLWVRVLAVVFLCLAVLLIFIKPRRSGMR
ncbi:MAG TPA: hypothetical protein PLN52_07925 [Opitutaceae bacterium]|nr:hypothetical protein [Opitutaceae bacterium]